jgi:hypothetical protein
MTEPLAGPPDPNLKPKRLPKEGEIHLVMTHQGVGHLYIGGVEVPMVKGVEMSTFAGGQNKMKIVLCPEAVEAKGRFHLSWFCQGLEIHSVGAKESTKKRPKGDKE